MPYSVSIPMTRAVNRAVSSELGLGDSSRLAVEAMASA
jgi:hypothetical protein